MNIFSKAPYRLTAYGISDLMDKYTALVDWKISHIITGEYFCPTIHKLEMEAVREVESILDKIKSENEECMEKLKRADCITSMQELNLMDIKEMTLTLSPYVCRRLTLMRVSNLFRI